MWSSFAKFECRGTVFEVSHPTQTGHLCVIKDSDLLSVLCGVYLKLSYPNVAVMLTCRYMTFMPSWQVFNISGCIGFPIKPLNDIVMSLTICDENQELRISYCLDHSFKRLKIKVKKSNIVKRKKHIVNRALLGSRSPILTELNLCFLKQLKTRNRSN